MHQLNHRSHLLGQTALAQQIALTFVGPCSHGDSGICRESQGQDAEELVEALFKVQLELRISMALKAGQQVTKRLMSATEKLKQKLKQGVQKA